MDYGLIVDLETTGLNPESDQIIEIGLLEFMVPQAGDAPVITSMYSAVEDPGVEITAEITKITGITTEMVVGRQIDWALVRSYFERAAVIIAHNAHFDRGFLVRRPELQPHSAHWACSVRHVRWEAHGFKSKALNYLAADHGFVNPFAHRALFDCATTFRVVAPRLQELIARSYEKEVQISAVGAPFEAKDRLKDRGYRWDNAQRYWHRTVSESELQEERIFLEHFVYSGSAQHVEEIIAFN